MTDDLDDLLKAPISARERAAFIRRWRACIGPVRRNRPAVASGGRGAASGTPDSTWGNVEPLPTELTQVRRSESSPVSSR